MIAAGTEQASTSQQVNLTAVWNPESAKSICKPFAILPDASNQITPIDTRQETRLPRGAQMRQFGRATMPVGKNAQQFAHFRALESWVGRVTEVEADQFIALVVSDKRNETTETAEFTFDEISDDDRSLVKVGALFYWSIGYQINEFGGRITASTLRFQRIRHWTRKEMELAKVKAAEYSDWFLGA